MRCRAGLTMEPLHAVPEPSSPPILLNSSRMQYTPVYSSPNLPVRAPSALPQDTVATLLTRLGSTVTVLESPHAATQTLKPRALAETLRAFEVQVASLQRQVSGLVQQRFLEAAAAEIECDADEEEEEDENDSERVDIVTEKTGTDKLNTAESKEAVSTSVGLQDDHSDKIKGENWRRPGGPVHRNWPDITAQVHKKIESEVELKREEAKDIELRSDMAELEEYEVGKEENEENQWEQEKQEAEQGPENPSENPPKFDPGKAYQTALQALEAIETSVFFSGLTDKTADIAYLKVYIENMYTIYLEKHVALLKLENRSNEQPRGDTESEVVEETDLKTKKRNLNVNLDPDKKLDYLVQIMGQPRQETDHQADLEALETRHQVDVNELRTKHAAQISFLKTKVDQLSGVNALLRSRNEIEQPGDSGNRYANHVTYTRLGLC
jgi:hypothetical protein